MKLKNVLLVSIDAVNTEILFNQNKYNIELKTINKLMSEGSYTRDGNTSVFPSFTYCAHQSIITGCHPEKHGINTNKLFDPLDKHNDAWYWYVNDRVPTLWEMAKQNGYYTVNVGFPSSVMAPTDLNIPEYWRDTTEFDSELLSAICTPQGLSKEFELQKNKKIPCGLWRIEDDETKLEQCLWIIENKLKDKAKDIPLFMTTYFASYDDIAHNEGTYSKIALEYLERTDKLLGELIKSLKSKLGENLVVCVISDHGMMDNIGDININAEFVRNGLIRTNSAEKILDYKAYCQRSGGAGLVKLSDDKYFSEVKASLESIQDKIPEKITAIMTGAEAKEKRHSCFDYDFIITTKPGWEIREDLTGDLIKTTPFQSAQHGYDENYPDMKAIFIIAGCGIPKGVVEGNSIIDIAPTLANQMGFTMESSQGRNILE